QRLCGGRRDVIGSTLTDVGGNDDDGYRIVGVLPKGFAFTQPVDVYRPQIVELPVARILHNWRYDRVIARLKPGVTLDRARAELEAAAAGLAERMPSTNAGWTAEIESLHSSIVGNFGRATWLLVAAVGVVLLVACLNVGGLLMARAVSRARETAVRSALGAGVWRLMRLWLAEAAVIAVLGGSLGLLLASLGVSALRAAAPPGIPRLDAVVLDRPTLAGAATATLIALAAFTIMPLLRVPKAQPVSGLRSGSAGAGTGRAQQRARLALTVAQCAGAATLVVLAIMLTRSFLKLTALDLGWKPDRVLSLTAEPPFPREIRRPWFIRVQWADQVIERLEAAPGIRRAAITTQVPLGPAAYPSTLGRGRGREGGDPARWPGVQQKVTDGYFDVMSIKLISGRTFNATDRFTEEQMTTPTRPERGVVMVSAQTAKTLWPGENAIGQSMWLPDIDSVSWREVIGVVDDIQFHQIGEAPGLHVFVPFTQDSSGSLNVLVKSDAATDAIAPVAKDIVTASPSNTTVTRITALDALVARATAQPRFTSRLVVTFGALALTLAAVGIYGTLSYLVGAGLREIGIRVALGASRRRILSNVVWRGLAPALAGGAIGLGIALALGQTFRALLFGIEPVDATSFAGGALALTIVAVAAALGPARRAASVDPVRALRAE
ncbi:MAG TPA: FtsX-like permease family protein, partial [Vicinamibacterales bacterium]|nr:FtsX-like permease family protein [Vicinamibacterales bacterium]